MSASRPIAATKEAIASFKSDSIFLAKKDRFFSLLSPFRVFQLATSLCYIWIQWMIIIAFKPYLPKSADQPLKPHGKIAVIGAGLTGISSAAHAIAHGFDVVIYEAGDKPGGIWKDVNSTSGLQLNSMAYRFHPSVVWTCAFPLRDEILSEIARVWKEYKLENRTRFNTRVISVKRSPASAVPAVAESDLNPAKGGHSRWIINDRDGPFDAVIVTIGTCGKPKKINFPGMPDPTRRHSEDEGGKHSGERVFKGKVLHSSELDQLQPNDLEGQTVAVIGSGASGVEAVETALAKGAKNTFMFARDDKWIIPRNILVDTFLAAQPFGRQMPLSFLWERFVVWWNYQGVEDLVPVKTPIFGGTPVVNDVFLPHVRDDKCRYIRGDTRRLTENGVIANVRRRGTDPGDPGEETEFEADLVILATGYERPDLTFLEEADLFPEGYERPNLYLQNFSTEDWSILLTNTAYVNAIGTVGHVHIGMYTRILLAFLLDKDTRPSPKDMKLWVDVLGFIKRGATGGALGFFTYMELTIWLLVFHVFRLDRIRWMFFIMQGWGVSPEEYRK